MPSGSYRQADVRCPFYKYDDGRRRITCEGLVEKSSIALIFHNKADYELHISAYCIGGCGRCEIYRALMEKYAD